MSQYLSLTAFAHAIGCSRRSIEDLVAEARIKVYQLGTGEPFIPRSELALAESMVNQGRLLTDNEENVLQADKDKASRAYSRAKIAAERKEEDIKIEMRRLRLSKRFTP